MKKLRLLLILLAVAGCSNPSSVLRVEDQPPSGKISDDGIEVFDPRVDILFVVDNSGSMQTHQNNLANNITKFIANFSVGGGNLDYRIGIVSTDMDRGAMCCGKLVGNPKYVDKNTPNANAALAANFRLGTSGSPEEHSFDPIVAALSQPNLGGVNQGFYRPEASIAVIFITDSEDQSRIHSNDLYNFLLNLKGRPDKVLGYGVIVPSNDKLNCPRDSSDKPKEIEAFLGRVSNGGNAANIMNLCAPDYGDRLAALGTDLGKRIGNVIYLRRPPVPSTIQVYFGTQRIPADEHAGWTFDPQKNALVLGDRIQWTNQPVGTKIRVTYDTARVD